MEDQNRSKFFETIKHSLSLKRTKITLYIVMVLWLAVGTQVAINYIFRDSIKITEAFVKTRAEEMQSSVEVIAEYEKDFLSEEDKHHIIVTLADAIGLTIDDEISVWKEGTRSEYLYQKNAKNANSEIKVVSMEQEIDDILRMKHYIIVRISISQSIQSIDRINNIIEDTLTEIGISEKQVTLQYTGNYQGAMSVREKKQIAKLMVEDLKGEISYEYEENGLYTVYAYTGLLNEYILSAGSKVNIQVAISYDEEKNKTLVYLATPILNQSW